MKATRFQVRIIMRSDPVTGCKCYDETTGRCPVHSSSTESDPMTIEITRHAKETASLEQEVQELRNAIRYCFAHSTDGVFGMSDFSEAAIDKVVEQANPKQG